MGHHLIHCNLRCCTSWHITRYHHKQKSTVSACSAGRTRPAAPAAVEEGAQPHGYDHNIKARGWCAPRIGESVDRSLFLQPRQRTCNRLNNVHCGAPQLAAPFLVLRAFTDMYFRFVQCMIFTTGRLSMSLPAVSQDIVCSLIAATVGSSALARDGTSIRVSDLDENLGKAHRLIRRFSRIASGNPDVASLQATSSSCMIAYAAMEVEPPTASVLRMAGLPRPLSLTSRAISHSGSPTPSNVEAMRQLLHRAIRCYDCSKYREHCIQVSLW